ncbi:MAG: PAS domain S-box protein [Deltaproteobacteria bacterium]|jgi:PAS domain S-box-containing protein|nr:PAS domain S-box protein [Deltaproteobacteria bacterium]
MEDSYIIKELVNKLDKLLKRIDELEKRETIHKQINAALIISETRYRRLFETAKYGILILDANTGKIADVNPFLVEMLGYSKEEFIGKELWEIGAFKDIKASKEAFKKLQKEEYVRYEHLPLETKDGHKVDVEFISNVYTVDHTKVIQCNIRNITARKEVEEEIKQRMKSLYDYYEIATERESKVNEVKNEIVNLMERFRKL